jgi:hypothetical protein
MIPLDPRGEGVSTSNQNPRKISAAAAFGNSTALRIFQADFHKPDAKESEKPEAES